MIYVLVNPSARGTASGAPAGIDVYTRALAPIVGQRATVRLVENRGLSREQLRREVRRVVLEHDPSTIVVEAPEACAATLDLPTEYFTHVRVHCPLGLAQHYDGVPVDYDALNEELRAISLAHVVSAPSHAMAAEIRSVLPDTPVWVFRNPPPAVDYADLPSEKDIDVLFLGRNQRLKGADFLPDILRRLPRRLRVCVAGLDMKRLRLPRGIVCSVERVDTIPGPHRWALLARSRVVMVPSRFESFSMVAAEALACRARVVAWVAGAPAELGSPSVLRVVPFGDTSAFARVVVECLRGQQPADPDFDEPLRLMRESASDGVRFVLESARGVDPRSPKICDHRRHHGLTEDHVPVLRDILDGKTMQGPTRGRLLRKLRKLRRDPRAFFRDARPPLIGDWLHELAARNTDRSAPPTKTKAEPKREPRYLGEVVWADGALRVERVKRRIAEPDLATAIFVEKSKQAYVWRPFLGKVLEDKKFVGFRDRYLFVFEHDLGGQFGEPGDLERLFEASPTFRKQPLAGIRNVVFPDPNDVLPALVRATTLDVRLIVFVSSGYSRLDLLESFASDIDVLVHAPDALNGRRIEARRRIESDDEEFVSVLRKLIIEHKSKEKNVLIPVFGDPGYREDIDELNARRLDGVILLSEDIQPAGTCFDDLLDRMVASTRAVLLREEKFHQYRDFCDRGDVRGLLSVSLADGCRYDVRA